MEEFKMITVDEAAKRLRAAGFQLTNAAHLRAGLEQGVYEFGKAIKMKGGTWVFEIYAPALDRWIKERS